jgi:putative spermidine/putrescine transport system ATP-binding protein
MNVDVTNSMIVVMRKGAVAQIGTPRTVYFEPASRFVAEFVGAANIVEGPLADGAIVLPGGRLPVSTTARAGDVSVMIRPETIAVVAAQTAPLRGCVDSVTFVGDRQKLSVSGAAARPLLIDAPNTLTVRAGDRIGLCVNPHLIRLLPFETSP